MPVMEFIAAAGIAAFTSFVVTLFSSATKEDYWYDFYNHYKTFPKEWTEQIDRILMTNPRYSKIGHTMYITANKSIPAEGYHYFYFESEDNRSWWWFNHYLGLRKIKKVVNNIEVYIYDCWISPRSINKMQMFNNLLILQNENVVDTISIDLSEMNPQLMIVNQIYKPPTNVQRSVINYIISHWINPNNHFNTKVFIHGKTGIGKSYTVYGLKKKLEQQYPHKKIRLFDDFNPSSIGVNIIKIALKDANENTPVILVINEINTSYAMAISQHVAYDPRESHTKDKTTFNNMLDAISRIKYVIVVFTSEKSPMELIAQYSEYKSFMRKGRVDMYIEMTQNTCNCTENILEDNM
jgi:hypothetical protein